MRNPVITLDNNAHRDKPVVSLRCEKNYTLIGRMKTITKAIWSQSRKFWYIPGGGFNLIRT